LHYSISNRIPILAVLLLLSLFESSQGYCVATTPISKGSLNSSDVKLKPKAASEVARLQVSTNSPTQIAAKANEDPLSYRSIVSAIITGSITFAALFGANSLLDLKRHRQMRPVLHINPTNNPSVAEKDIDLSIYDITKPDLPADLRKISRLNLHYRVNRIKVKNNGISAAEDCKGVIIQNGVEMKVCWSIPTERHKMTINAKSHEYLDLCSHLVDSPLGLAQVLKQNVSKLPESYVNSSNTSVILEDVRRLRVEFLQDDPDDEGNAKLIDRYFPNIIAPTENGWQQPPHLNWVLKPGQAKVRITSKNTAPIEYNIEILQHAEDGRIAKIGKKEKII
jgi:hypothetical protein